MPCRAPSAAQRRGLRPAGPALRSLRARRARDAGPGRPRGRPRAGAGRGEAEAPEADGPAGRAAAFFDMDGTLMRTNIVRPYALVRRRELGWWRFLLWAPGFLLKCVAYLAVDLFDRSRVQAMVYRNYAGRAASEKAALGRLVYTEYLAKKLWPAAVARVKALQAEGFRIVLVTGSLDFLVKDVADELGVDHVIAAKLEEAGGFFTGEIDGPPLSDEEKRVRVRAYAAAHGIDLARSHAYGDSKADLPLLEAVGVAHAICPDPVLSRIAGQRDWPILDWAGSG